MGSMNNWLGFSLSPTELPPSSHYPYQAHPSPTTVTSNCFSFSTDHSASDNNHQTPLVDIDFLSSAPHHQHQEWNMKNCELSMLVGSDNKSINNSEPKMGDFLSGQSYLYNEGYPLQLPVQAVMPTMPNINAEESQSSSNLPLAITAGVGVEERLALENKKDDEQCGAKEVTKKSVETFGQRTSIYRGVTRHRWTGRYEAHLWDNSCKREGQTRKGRQVYLGGYDKEDKAARAYDLAALKYWGATTTTNFPISNYVKEIEEMKHMTRQEYIASLRRKSSGFSRGASIYRGVTRHHQHGRWQARIGRVAGNKDLYLGTFTTQEEAAEAYDIAAIKFRGLNAITNFEMSRYDVKSILESSNLPIGPSTKRLKDSSSSDNSSTITEGISNYGWPPTLAFQQSQYPYNNYQHSWCKQEEDYSTMPAQTLQNLNSYGIGSCSTLLELGTGMSSDVYYSGRNFPSVLGWSDSYKNAYYEQSSGCSALMEASAQGIAQANVCNGAPPLFTVWDES
ncbi:AP2-like ethylene-responsive transcription factor BBM isoform X1 [Asparagus officinalis]|nr:AP2-like ethylene-responsive transcription factor BBM isoform X1 [Asparagus officinalis]